MPTYKTGWYPFEQNELAPDNIAGIGFESRIGADPKALREDGLARTRIWLLANQPWITGLPASIQNAVILAEQLVEKRRDFSAFRVGRHRYFFCQTGGAVPQGRAQIGQTNG
jgi:hypothetical protein